MTRSLALLLSATLLIALAPSCDRPDSEPTASTTAPQTPTQPVAQTSQPAESAATKPTTTAVSAPDAKAQAVPASSSAGTTAAAVTTSMLPGNVKSTITRPGSGAPPKLGDRVAIHWSGSFGGREFWNSRTGGKPQEEVLSYQELIPGMVDALLQMRPGERRTLDVPSSRAYGAEGYPHVVPPNTDLQLDLELVAVR